jgi:tetratricopeptide (TPR) repeat protein
VRHPASGADCRVHGPATACQFLSGEQAGRRHHRRGQQAAIEEGKSQQESTSLGRMSLELVSRNDQEAADCSGAGNQRALGVHCNSDETPNASSSKSDAERCNEAMELALQAAHNVDVGDLQFEEKHYAAALSRYEEAAQEKSGDAAIHVRIGRVQEKLHDDAKAIEQYTTAVQIGTPDKWTSEARSALARLNSAKK